MKHSLVLIAMASAACGVESSSSLLTSGMSGEMTAQSSGDGTASVTAELFDGDPLQLIFVDLGSGDELIAHHGSESQTMQKLQLLTIVQYGATFDNAADGDTFSVELQRTVDDGAPSSTMTLPPSFDLDQVPATASRATDLSLSWSPTSSEPMSWQVTGPCIATADGAVSGGDTGAITIPAASIQLASGEMMTSCEATVTISRTLAGTIDSHFGEGGNADGAQVRSATFTTTP
ncbi:MAG TPA: hypothetical protein VGL61_06930 [Kofleriaceae bacterium]|jgi:hypothetical protein